MILIEMLLLFLFVNIMVYKGLKHPALFSGITNEDIQIVEDSKEMYATSQLKADDLIMFKNTLDEFMKNEKPYLNPDLTLGDLAKMISISSRELSQVINTQFNKNFSEYINYHRIEYSIHLFNTTNDKKLTVLEVLFESGFNSKSSFYNAFKKHTNMNPKEYRSNIRS